jgi:hypothetical protein
MSRKNGIISFENNVARISFNNRIFETKDKSVIAMAQRGNVAGAAKRWIGKSSAARTMRAVNKSAIKPVYPNVAESLFKKVFKEKGKSRVKIENLGKFAQEYKNVTSANVEEIFEKIKNKAFEDANFDRLPGDLKSKIESIIKEEVEKAYSEKGFVDNSDIERINNRVAEYAEEYVRYGDLSEDEIINIMKVMEMPIEEVLDLEVYISKIKKR